MFASCMLPRVNGV